MKGLKQQVALSEYEFLLCSPIFSVLLKCQDPKVISFEKLSPVPESEPPLCTLIDSLIRRVSVSTPPTDESRLA